MNLFALDLLHIGDYKSFKSRTLAQTVASKGGGGGGVGYSHSLSSKNVRTD